MLSKLSDCFSLSLSWACIYFCMLWMIWIASLMKAWIGPFQIQHDNLQIHKRINKYHNFLWRKSWVFHLIFFSAVKWHLIKIDQGILILQLKKDQKTVLFLLFSECFHLYVYLRKPTATRYPFPMCCITFEVVQCLFRYTDYYFMLYFLEYNTMSCFILSIDIFYFVGCGECTTRQSVFVGLWYIYWLWRCH